MSSAGDRSSADPLARVFGTLELRVLDALWARGEAASVRDLAPVVTGIAYTTLMTTLERLCRKGVLSRVKDGRRFQYEARLTREQVLSTVAGDALAALLGPRARDLRPVVSFFVDAVSNDDRAVLDTLDALIRERGQSKEPA